MDELRVEADRAPVSGALQLWEPSKWPVAADWQGLVKRFFQSDRGLRLSAFAQARLANGATVYPQNPLKALALTSLAQVRVVILGQDPYHGPGQAHGLAFSVAEGVAVPPSLRNIFKEIARDNEAKYATDQKEKRPTGGSLEHWAQQGVLLLNTCLTVEQGSPASHAKQGWESLTDAIIQATWASPQPTVFMLWGAHAQAKQVLMDAALAPQHLVLAANHPSPLSALRPPKPFIGCGHFGLANAFLRKHRSECISW